MTPITLQWSLPNVRSGEQLVTVGIQRPQQKESYNIMEDVKYKTSRKSAYRATMENNGDLELHFLGLVEAWAAKTHGKCAISRRNTQTRILLGM
jgi:hypothetical protein